MTEKLKPKELTDLTGLTDEEVKKAIENERLQKRLEELEEQLKVSDEAAEKKPIEGKAKELIENTDEWEKRLEKRLKRKERGFGVVEVIIAISIITTSFLGLLELTRYSLRVQERSQKQTEALSLAIETAEAIRSIRNESWNNLTSLSYGTKYYPVISAGKWTTSLTNPGPINGVYERWVTVEKVYRDGNDDISLAGTEDDQTRKITAEVEWLVQNKTQNVVLTTYLTNWYE